MLRTLRVLLEYGYVAIWVSWASCIYVAPQVLNLTLMGEAAEHDASEPNGTHDLAFGRARVEATVSSSSAPSQRSNPLPAAEE